MRLSFTVTGKDVDELCAAAFKVAEDAAPERDIRIDRFDVTPSMRAVADQRVALWEAEVRFSSVLGSDGAPEDDTPQA